MINNNYSLNFPRFKIPQSDVLKLFILSINSPCYHQELFERVLGWALEFALRLEYYGSLRVKDAVWRTESPMRCRSRLAVGATPRNARRDDRTLSPAAAQAQVSSRASGLPRIKAPERRSGQPAAPTLRESFRTSGHLCICPGSDANEKLARDGACGASFGAVLSPLAVANGLLILKDAVFLSQR